MAFTYDKIQSLTSSGGGAITFNSIPSTYTDLRFIFTGATAGSITYLIYNGDTGANYHTILAWAQGVTTTARYSQGWTFAIPPAGSEETQQRIDIMDYSNYTTFKTSISRVNVYSMSETFGIQCWRSTAAINSVSLFSSGTLGANYTATLYGIKKD